MECPYCLKQIEKPARFDDHIKKRCVTKHNNGECVLYHRHYCWRTFKTKQSLADHKKKCNFKICSDKARNKCSVCEVRFQRKEKYISPEDHECIRLNPKGFVNFIDATQ